MCDIHSDAVDGTRCGDECCPGYSKHACAVCAAPLCTACAEPCMSCGESGTPAAVFCGDCCPPAADCCPAPPAVQAAHSLGRPYRQLVGPDWPSDSALGLAIWPPGTVHEQPRRSTPVHYETLERLDLPRPLRCFGCSSVCCDTCSVLMHSCSVCGVSACEECLGLKNGTRRDTPRSGELPACDWNLCPCCEAWQCVACTFELEWSGMPTRVGRKHMSAGRCLRCTDMGAELPKPVKQVQSTSRYGAGGLPLDAKTVGKSVRAALRGHPELTVFDIQEHLETKLGDLTAWRGEIKEATLVFTLAKAQDRVAKAQAAVDEFNARLQLASGAEAIGAAAAAGAAGALAVASGGYIVSSESREEKE